MVTVNGVPSFQLVPHAQELGYVLRKAKIACGLKGVYVLRADSAVFLPGQYGSRSAVDP
jgi:hypothetical protein